MLAADKKNTVARNYGVIILDRIGIGPETDAHCVELYDGVLDKYQLLEI